MASQVEHRPSAGAFIPDVVLGTSDGRGVPFDAFISYADATSGVFDHTGVWLSLLDPCRWERASLARAPPAPLRSAVLARLRRHGAFLLLLLAGLAVAAPGLDWGVPARKGWAPDELLPQDVLRGRAQGFSQGWSERYPPLHYRLLALVYTPWLDDTARSAREPLPLELHGRLTRVGRSLSLLMWAGLLACVYACGLRLFGRRAALISAALVALCLPLVFYAKLANLEVPYLFWWAASLPLMLAALEGRRGATVPLLALCAALAVTTKDQAYALFVLLPVPILAARVREQPAGPGARRLLSALAAPDLGPAVLLFLVVFGLVHGLPGNVSGFASHLETMLASGQAFRQFPGGVPGQLELLRAAAAGLAFCLGWPACLLAAVGLALELRGPRDPRLLALLAPAVSLHVFFLAVVLYCYDRFLLPTAIVACLFAARGADRLLAAGGARRVAGALGLAAALLFGLWRAVSLDVHMLNDGRYAVEDWLETHARAGEAVGQLAPSLFLPRLKPQGLRAVGPDVEELRAERPRLLVGSVAYSRRAQAPSAERAFQDALDDGSAGYRLVLEKRYSPPFPLWDPRELERAAVDSNLERVNPLIRVYERVDAP